MSRNDIIRDLTVANLDIVQKHLIDTIPDANARSLATSSINDLERIIFALIDENPNDVDQVKAIVRNFASEPLLQYGETELTEAILRIRREELKALLLLVAPTTSNAMRLLLDGDKDNNDEVEQLFIDLVKSPGFITTALTLLLSLINRGQRA